MRYGVFSLPSAMFAAIVRHLAGVTLVLRLCYALSSLCYGAFRLCYADVTLVLRVILLLLSRRVPAAMVNVQHKNNFVSKVGPIFFVRT